MKFKALVTAMALALPATLLADSGRLIVTTKVAVGYDEMQALAQQPGPVFNKQHCLTLTSGESWCVPYAQRTAQQSINSYGSAQTTQVLPHLDLQSAVIKVPASLSLAQAQQLLQSTGLYDYVETDVVIKAQDLYVSPPDDREWNATPPNDPDFMPRQLGYFADNSAKQPVASSILAMWQKLVNPTKEIELYVMDGGFRAHSDIIYQPGFNFVVNQYDNERKPGFLEEDFNVECTSSHGLLVASTAAATTNNELGIAGVAGATNVHPLRLLNCRSGWLSDVAAALDWLSGNDAYLRTQSPDLPVFNGKPGVINMSLGGLVENGCPLYLQSAINKAVAEGFTIVTSAGNENQDVAKSAPANCANVISVGAATDPESVTIDKASFSNFGKTLDIMAMGEQIMGLTQNETTSLWAGTSAAAPIVSGILANLLKDFSLTPQQLEVLVQISGIARWGAEAECKTLGCGSGVLDAVKLYDNANRLLAGSLNRAEYSLASVSPALQDWALTHLAEGPALCNQVTLTIEHFGRIDEREVIKLYSQDGAGANASAELLGEFTTSRFFLTDSQVQNKQLFVEKCHLDSQSCSARVELEISGLQQRPQLCN